jgi:hypothetical protein
MIKFLNICSFLFLVLQLTACSSGPSKEHIFTGRLYDTEGILLGNVMVPPNPPFSAVMSLKFRQMPKFETFYHSGNSKGVFFMRLPVGVYEVQAVSSYNGPVIPNPTGSGFKFVIKPGEVTRIGTVVNTCHHGWAKKEELEKLKNKVEDSSLPKLIMRYDQPMSVPFRNSTDNPMFSPLYKCEIIFLRENDDIVEFQSKFPDFKGKVNSAFDNYKSTQPSR